MCRQPLPVHTKTARTGILEPQTSPKVGIIIIFSRLIRFQRKNGPKRSIFRDPLAILRFRILSTKGQIPVHIPARAGLHVDPVALPLNCISVKPSEVV